MADRLRAGRAIAALALVSGLVALGSPASADVSVSPSRTEPGAASVLTFSVDHGCSGSRTTGLSIEMPDGIYAVTPTRSALWSVRTETRPLDEPVEVLGGSIRERVDRVEFTARHPLPDGVRDTVEVLVQLPQGADDAVVSFPTVQQCENGSVRWTAAPSTYATSDGSLDNPAPAFRLGPDTGNPPLVAPVRGDSPVLLLALALSVLATLLAAAALIRAGGRDTKTAPDDDRVDLTVTSGHANPSPSASGHDVERLS